MLIVFIWYDPLHPSSKHWHCVSKWSSLSALKQFCFDLSHPHDRIVRFMLSANLTFCKLKIFCFLSLSLFLSLLWQLEKGTQIFTYLKALSSDRKVLIHCTLRIHYIPGKIRLLNAVCIILSCDILH